MSPCGDVCGAFILAFGFHIHIRFGWDFSVWQIGFPIILRDWMICFGLFELSFLSPSCFTFPSPVLKTFKNVSPVLGLLRYEPGNGS
jgi:hypothetical protein